MSVHDAQAKVRGKGSQEKGHSLRKQERLKGSYIPMKLKQILCFRIGKPF